MPSFKTFRVAALAACLAWAQSGAAAENLATGSVRQVACQRLTASADVSSAKYGIDKAADSLAATHWAAANKPPVWIQGFFAEPQWISRIRLIQVKPDRLYSDVRRASFSFSDGTPRFLHHPRSMARSGDRVLAAEGPLVSHHLRIDLPGVVLRRHQRVGGRGRRRRRECAGRRGMASDPVSNRPASQPPQPTAAPGPSEPDRQSLIARLCRSPCRRASHAVH